MGQVEGSTRRQRRSHATVKGTTQRRPKDKCDSSAFAPTSWGSQCDLRPATVGGLCSPSMRNGTQERNVRLPGIYVDTNFSTEMDKTTNRSPLGAGASSDGNENGEMQRPVSRGAAAAERLMKQLHWGSFKSVGSGSELHSRSPSASSMDSEYH